MSDDLNRQLIIFLKPPVAGKVKTRLADDIGEEAALQIYIKLLRLTAKAADGVDCAKRIWVSENPGHQPIPGFEGETLLAQQGDDLGERMAFAFKSAFAEGAEKAVIIGSDCPDVTSDLIEQAFNRLDSHDLVIGPSEDGGYWLHGMKQLHNELFERIPWSTPDVYPQTERAAAGLGLSISRLPVLNDIDNLSDLGKSAI